MPNQQKPAGVIGAGSFGTAIANLLAHNVDVLVYSRNPEIVKKINTEHRNIGIELSPRIKATDQLSKLAAECDLLFPVIPSSNFREMILELGKHLKPYHIIIHGTKGFDISGISPAEIEGGKLRPKHVRTMSQLILDETVVRRVGCLSGPNLAQEILDGQPTATVIASAFEEVITLGKDVLKSDAFHVFGNRDILGAELAGVLKNTIAIGSGILKGRGLGKNIQAMLITRGLVEMIYFGKHFGAETKAFFGTAGIGDLVATATSKKSRNYTFGYRLGQGEDIETIQKTMPELAEGVRTLQIVNQLANHYKMRVPITRMLYKSVFEGFDIDKAIRYLISYPYDIDVDFL